MNKALYRQELRAGIHDTRLKAKGSLTKARQAAQNATMVTNRKRQYSTIEKARIAIAEASHSTKGVLK